MDQRIAEIKQSFDLLDNWQDKYSYLMELGSQLEPLAAQYHKEEYKIKGCASQVWLFAEIKDNIYHFIGDSDSHIVKGLLYLALSFYNNKTAEQIKQQNLKLFLKEIGLEEHLTLQRNNGLQAVIDKINYYASIKLERSQV